MRQKRKLFEIKVYEYNTDGRFYRASSEGMSVPASTIKKAINDLLVDMRKLDMLEQQGGKE